MVVFLQYYLYLFPTFSKSLLNKAGLPTVDLQDPEAPHLMSLALKDWGFSYITGHGIPEEVIKEANDENRRFFNLPGRVKRQVQGSRSTLHYPYHQIKHTPPRYQINTTRPLKTIRGYTEFGGEGLGGRGKRDLKEVLDIGYLDKAASKNSKHYLGENIWPKDELYGRSEELQNAIKMA